MEVDITYLTIIGSVVLPVLTGLVTKRVASSGVKALVLVILSVVASLIQQLINADGRFDVEPFLTGAFAQFLLAVGVHYGALKPFAITGANGVIQQAVPGGVGSATGATATVHGTAGDGSTNTHPDEI